MKASIISFLRKPTGVGAISSLIPITYSDKSQRFLQVIALTLSLATYASAVPVTRTADPIAGPNGSGTTITQPTRAYQAIPLGAFGIIVACHRSLTTEGFINSRGWGTDSFVGMGMVAIAVLWTGGIVVSSVFEYGNPCRHDLLLCAGRLIYAPHILNATVLLWFIYLLSAKFKLPLWKQPEQYHRDAWSAAFNKFRIPLVVNTLLTCLIMFLAAGATKGGDYTAAVMTIVGCAVYVVRAGGSMSYNDPEVPYRNHNFIRAVLNTDHDAGTVYTTSSDGVSMEPVWSYVWPNQITAVKTKLVPALQKLKLGEFDVSAIHHGVRETGLSVVLSTTMDNDHLHKLASWLLSPRPIYNATDKPQQFGRELFYYLYIVELFLFVHRHRLSPELRERLCKWRVIQHSGAFDIGSQKHYSANGGKAGLTEAFLHVGELLGKVPQLEFVDVNPSHSMLPAYDPLHPEGYTGQLWTYCLGASEGVFAALYIFSVLFETENGVRCGLHSLPIRTDKKDGDVIAHQIIWRQAWYVTMVAQFTASGVAIAGA